MIQEVSFLSGEFWWGGTNYHGVKMPLSEKSDYTFTMKTDAITQTMPMFLSSKGRYLWAYGLKKAEFRQGKIFIECDQLELVQAEGSTLKDAHLAAMKAHFPFENKELPEVFFRTAQYNGWIQFLYSPTQEGVLQYARQIVEHGFLPGILIIDEGWHQTYGTWEFDFSKFPDPKKMMEELHRMGFVVMLWVCPFVTCSGELYVKELAKEPELFLKTERGDVAVIRWWNGQSAILDFTKACDRSFMNTRLEKLMREYGVDGFKFDGGAVTHYLDDNCINGRPDPLHTAAERNRAWIDLGAAYPYHEYKDAFDAGGRAIIQRMQDRDHSWVGNGLDTLIPNSIMQGLLGYPYLCPDMVGGGQWTVFYDPSFVCDEELFIRMAQCSVYCPMMQFSLAPWENLSPENLVLCVEAARLHHQMGDRIVALVRHAMATGEPVVRNMEYEFPHQGLQDVKDCFMLGSTLLVAPVIEQEAVTKTVRLPQGKWRWQDGSVLEGGKEVTVDAPLEVIPVFEKIG